ncbi:helix-turn-helix domain-containing protein [Undibacterium sp. LX15W]|uniref:Helix-turn-helix domain-containing protein n=2 Tax=Undibacterium flavidum TaxID=2762297 RepID=A0ABR6YBM6_9BURK|nr:helix-turn-helix domain-containing protein [Undibacterium flavidum]
MSIIELAAKSGLNRNTIANLEAGRGNVELNTLISICHVLKLAIQLIPEHETDIPKPNEMRNETPLYKLLKSKSQIENSASSLYQKLTEASTLHNLRETFAGLSSPVAETLASQFDDTINQSSSTTLEQHLAAVASPITQYRINNPQTSIQKQFKDTTPKPRSLSKRTADAATKPQKEKK